MPLHLIKLSVGTESIADLQGWIDDKIKAQKKRGVKKPERIHTTRMVPKRADELKDGGSIFSTVAAVDTSASRVKVKALQAAAVALDDRREVDARNTKLAEHLGEIEQRHIARFAGFAVVGHRISPFQVRGAEIENHQTCGLPYGCQARTEKTTAVCHTRLRDDNAVPSGSFTRQATG